MSVEEATRGWLGRRAGAAADAVRRDVRPLLFQTSRYRWAVFENPRYRWRPTENRSRCPSWFVRDLLTSTTTTSRSRRIILCHVHCRIIAHPLRSSSVLLGLAASAPNLKTSISKQSSAGSPRMGKRTSVLQRESPDPTADLCAAEVRSFMWRGSPSARSRDSTMSVSST